MRTVVAAHMAAQSFPTQEVRSSNPVTFNVEQLFTATLLKRRILSERDVVWPI